MNDNDNDIDNRSHPGKYQRAAFKLILWTCCENEKHEAPGCKVQRHLKSW